MDPKNSFAISVGRKRWLKKLLPWRPAQAYVTVRNGLKLYVDWRDLRGPSFHVMYGGAPSFESYETGEKEAILSHLPEQGVFLDIGANIGLFSFYIHQRRPRAAIHAFEPHPVNFECLRRSCEMNAVPAIEPHRAAVSDRSGELELFLDESDAGGHSVNRGALRNNRAQTRIARVPAIRLDDFVRERGLTRLDVIKIDIQGAEAAAIRGARECIARFRPAMLLECDHLALIDDHAAEASAGSLVEAIESTGVRYSARRVLEGGALEAPLPLAQLADEARRQAGAGQLQANYLFTV